MLEYFIDFVAGPCANHGVLIVAKVIAHVPSPAGEGRDEGSIKCKTYATINNSIYSLAATELLYICWVLCKAWQTCPFPHRHQ